MSDRSQMGPAASAGGLALALLCAQQFIMSYDTGSMNAAISTTETTSTVRLGNLTEIRSFETSRNAQKHV